MKLPDFLYEKKLWKKGYKFIAGVDEVGRGSLAGPVVAGAVVFDRNLIKIKHNGVIINDSKKLSAKQRERATAWIKENALSWAVGEASVSKINKLGIVKATQIAFRMAIKKAQLKQKIDYLLIDAFYAPYVVGLRKKKQMPIVKGDTKSISIEAASIIAKVYRDKLMTELSKQPKHKKYEWNKNKGYGTLDHRNVIKKYGATNLHRKDFVKHN